MNQTSKNGVFLASRHPFSIVLRMSSERVARLLTSASEEYGFTATSRSKRNSCSTSNSLSRAESQFKQSPVSCGSRASPQAQEPFMMWALSLSTFPLMLLTNSGLSWMPLLQRHRCGFNGVHQEYPIRESHQSSLPFVLFFQALYRLR